VLVIRILLAPQFVSDTSVVLDSNFDGNCCRRTFL
jgi:hypothetical protein